jgi:hypothetical protein
LFFSISRGRGGHKEGRERRRREGGRTEEDPQVYEVVIMEIRIRL